MGAVRGIINLIIVSAFEVGINILWAINEFLKFLFVNK
jgi:hypothetical protein